jgi:hypothetical protein
LVAVVRAARSLHDHGPELFVDHAAEPERRIVVTDDFGQRVQMSAEQFQVLVEQARSGQLDEVLTGLGVS